MTALTVWTIGHSIRAADEFIQILRAHKIRTLADVRSFPASRRYPHFNRNDLETSSGNVGIQYLHLPELGGRRRPSVDSKNTNLRNASFRAYADYMESDGFREGIEILVKLAREKRTAVMCAEAVWWKCHRSLIADYLKSKHTKVIHILGSERTEIHPYSPAARLFEGQLSYRGLLA